MSSNSVVTVTDGNFQTEVMESNIPVLVDFWAPWCGPCKALGPVLEKIAVSREGKIKICKVNVEDNPTLAAKFNIRNIPFMAFVQNGEKVKDLVGNQPEAKILDVIDSLQPSNKDLSDNEKNKNKEENKNEEENKNDDENKK